VTTSPTSGIASQDRRDAESDRSEALDARAFDLITHALQSSSRDRGDGG
jgi:hypothetical protein